MRNPHDGGFSGRKEKVSVGADILPFPARDPQQIRNKLIWLRLVAATRDPLTWALLREHRRPWSEYRRRCA
jgi:hypothetical protein